MTIDELSRLNDDQLDAVIQKDSEGKGEILAELRRTLMEQMQAVIFPDSETFGDAITETSAERHLRVLIESMNFRTTLSGIYILYDLDEEDEDDDE